MPKLFFVFDVESVGLHGEGYHVGFVVVDECGETLDAQSFGCDPLDACGNREGRKWIAANSPSLAADLTSPRMVRNEFWRHWSHWRDRGAVMVADCAWPVEARFLMACVHDDPETREGPYPLHDLASVLLAAGLDSLKDYPRIPGEQPKHNPLCDARQSARLLVTALGEIGEWKKSAGRGL